MTDSAPMVWRKSQRSGTGDNCVELAAAPGVVLVRDSKNPGEGALEFHQAAWRRLVTAIKQGHHVL